MKTNATKILTLGLSAFFVLAIASLPSITRAEYGSGMNRAPLAAHLPVSAPQRKGENANPLVILKRLADAHTDACVYNYNQCMTGCDGATSCSNQCKTNYDGCMGQQP